MAMRNDGEVAPLQIDRDKLKVRARRLDRWALFLLLDRAIDHVPDAAMAALIEQVVKPQEVTRTASLLEDVREFERLSRTGHYYEPFDATWKNGTPTAPGTDAWLANCVRLFQRCAGAVGVEGDDETLAAFELLFRLLDSVDEGEEIVVWADEGGSYEVNPGWPAVLPTYFQLLSRAAAPEEYGRLCLRAINFAGYPKDQLLGSARSFASEAQLKHLL